MNNTNDKSLVIVNKNSIFYKIKKFFRNLFSKKDNNITPIENRVLKTQEIANDKKDSFRETITNIENDETRLLKLQKQYRSGEIKEEDMTEDQVNSLCLLYDKQIRELKRANELRKQKLMEYRKKLQTDN